MYILLGVRCKKDAQLRIITEFGVALAHIKIKKQLDEYPGLVG